MSCDPATALLDDIEAKASAATPGPYELRGSHELRAVDRGGMRVGLYPHIGRFARAGDAAFFAGCDPATILALVRVARAAMETRMYIIDDGAAKPLDAALDALAQHRRE